MWLASWNCVLETILCQCTRHCCHCSALSLGLGHSEFSQLRCLEAVSALATIHICASEPLIPWGQPLAGKNGQGSLYFGFGPHHLQEDTAAAVSLQSQPAVIGSHQPGTSASRHTRAWVRGCMGADEDTGSHSCAYDSLCTRWVGVTCAWGAYE